MRAVRAAGPACGSAYQGLSGSCGPGLRSDPGGEFGAAGDHAGPASGVGVVVVEGHDLGCTGHLREHRRWEHASMRAGAPRPSSEHPPTRDRVAFGREQLPQDPGEIAGKHRFFPPDIGGAVLVYHQALGGLLDPHQTHRRIPGFDQIKGSGKPGQGGAAGRVASEGGVVAYDQDRPRGSSYSGTQQWWAGSRRTAVR